MNLSEVSIGSKCSIIGFLENNVIKRRLMDMGLTPSCVVEIIKVAPMGDPIEIKVRGYSLSIRKDEAKIIEVEVL